MFYLQRSWLFEIAIPLVRFDYFDGYIVIADHRIV
jgi:hypothetical protein